VALPHDFLVVVDGIFGPATELAVRRFQAGAGLPPSGVVDRPTSAKLLAPMERALAPIDPAPRGFGRCTVAYARQHLEEHPREVGGQNRGPWVRLYMGGNEGTAWPWCAGFACSFIAHDPLQFDTTFQPDSLIFFSSTHAQGEDTTKRRPSDSSGVLPPAGG
jgi:hypothetical protein